MCVCVCAHLFVLVGGDGDELGLFEGDVGNQAMLRADAHDVQLRLVLVEGVQHDLTTQTSPLQLFILLLASIHTCPVSTPVHTCAHLFGPVWACLRLFIPV